MPQRVQRADHLQRAGQFRRQRHQPHVSFRRPGGYVSNGRQAQMGRVVCALLLRVEKGAFAVQAKRDAALPAGRWATLQRFLRLRHLLQRRGDNRRQEAGHAPARQTRRHPPDCVGRQGEVVAERTVELQVDKAGRHEQAAGVDDLGVVWSSDAGVVAHSQNTAMFDQQHAIIDLHFGRQYRRSPDTQHRLHHLFSQ